MTKRVFVSYSTDDLKLTQRLVAYLEDHHIACWVGYRDIGPGKNWKQEITQAMNEAGALVLVLSRHSAASHDVGVELELAKKRGLLILLFLIDHPEKVKAMEYDMALRQYINAGPDPTDEHFAIVSAQLTESARLSSSVPRPKHGRYFWALRAGPLSILFVFWAVMAGPWRTPPPVVDRSIILEQLEKRANEDTSPLAKADSKRKAALLKDLREVIVEAQRTGFRAHAQYWSALEIFWQSADAKAPQKMKPDVLLTASTRLTSALAFAKSERQTELAVKVKVAASTFRNFCDLKHDPKVWTPGMKRLIHEQLDPIVKAEIP